MLNSEDKWEQREELLGKQWIMIKQDQFKEDTKPGKLAAFTDVTGTQSGEDAGHQSER